MLCAVAEYDDPPDYPDLFYKRRTMYAKLGIEAFELAVELSKYAKLTKLEMPPYDPVKIMRDTLARMEMEERQRQESQARIFHESSHQCPE
jgi:hypothetical protein